MEILKMADWPGTPGRARMELAHRMIQRSQREGTNQTRPLEEATELSQVHQDIRMITAYKDIQDFHTDSHEDAESLVRAEQVQSNYDLLRVAENGSDERFIALLIDLDDPPENPEEERVQEYRIIMTKLHRDSEWVGMNEILPYCRGLEVHIFCREGEPEEPNLILAVMPGGFEEDGDDEAPPGISQVIQKVMEWHGALRCQWHHPPARRKVTAGRRR